MSNLDNDRAETYDYQLNLLHEWVRSGFISRLQFKELLSLLV